MHELSITRNLLVLVLGHASRASARRVTDVHLVVGELSPIVDECVQFYWNLVAEGTPAAGARLHFEHRPFELTCTDCGAAFRPPGDYRCPVCSGIRVRVTGGEEFGLESIDVESEEAELPRSPGA